MKIDVQRQQPLRRLRSNRAVGTPEAEQEFGQEVERPQAIAPAPIQAFGDTSGQVAIANSLSSAGNKMLDIAARERAMQEAEDDANLKRMRTEYNFLEAQTRYDLEREQEQEMRTPDQKLEEYNRRVGESRSKVIGDYQFKTIGDETLNSAFDDITQTRELEYRAGQIEKDRVDNVKLQYAKTLQMFTEQAARAGADNDIATLEQTLSEIGNLTSTNQFIATYGQEGAHDARAKMTLDAVKGFVRELAEREPEDAKAVLENTEGFISQFLSDEDMSVAREDLQRIIFQEADEKRKAENQRVEKLYGQMDLGIELGKVGKTDILDSSLPEGKKAVLLRRIDDQTVKATKEQKSYSEITNLIKSGGTYAHEGKSKQGVVDDWYPMRLDELSEMEPQQAIKLITEEIAQVGIVPTTMKANIEGRLHSEDDGEVQDGAQAIVTLSKHNPRLLNQFPPESQALASMINANVPVEVAKDKLTRVSQMTEVEQKAWYTKASEDTEEVADHITALVDDRFDWDGMDASIVPTIGAQEEYRRLYQQNLILTQGTDTAKELTDAQFLSIWSKTNLDNEDGRLMKYPPELMYGDGQEAPWMRSQLTSDLEVAGYVDSEVELIYDNQSPLSAPLYFVMVNDSGFMRPALDAEGSVLRWRPNKDKFHKDEIARRKEEFDKKPKIKGGR